MIPGSREISSQARASQADHGIVVRCAAMIAHIVKRDEWDEAVRRGSYVPQSLRVEGFIHCSTPAQVIETANRFYRGQRDLIVVSIEEKRVTAEVRWEAAVAPHRGHGDSAAEPSPTLSREITGEAPEIAGEAPGELFPHLYGELNLDAVVRVVELVWEEERGFRIDSDGAEE
jgi:uncharacterized protein (DUF952 family)